MAASVTIDGRVREAKAGKRLIDLINRIGEEVLRVGNHPRPGRIQACDTCMVEVNSALARTVFEPLEGSRPNCRMVQDVADHLGANWHYNHRSEINHPSQIMGEIAFLTPMFAGVNERLAGYQSLQWPVAADGSDQPLP